jgi:hypothetical protein
LTPDAYNHHKGKDGMLMEFISNFQGFDQLTQLSDDEMEDARNKYIAFQFPDIREWGPHLTTMSHLASALLIIKQSGDRIKVDNVPVLKDKGIMQIVYAIAILNLMDPSSSTLTENILKEMDKNVSLEYAPAAYFAKNYASDSKTPFLLVETTLKYCTWDQRMPQSTFAVIAKYGFHEYFNNSDLFSAWHNLGKKRKGPLFCMEKAKVLLNTCCMLPSFPNIQILNHWIREKRKGDTRMQIYYKTNPNILYSALIHDLSLMTALDVIDSKANAEIVARRLKKTLQYAKKHLLVTKSEMQQTIILVLDYFLLYHCDTIPDPMSDGIQPHLEDHLINLHSFHNDELTKIAAVGMLEMLGSRWDTWSGKGAKSLWEAFQKLLALFIDVYNTEDEEEVMEEEEMVINRWMKLVMRMVLAN